MDRGTIVYAVTTKEVSEIFFAEYHQIVKDSISKGILKIWVLDEDLKEAFIITDSAISFNLFTNSGVFDLESQLVCNSDEAIFWGNELFEYYRKRANKIELWDI